MMLIMVLVLAVIIAMFYYLPFYYFMFQKPAIGRQVKSKVKKFKPFLVSVVTLPSPLERVGERPISSVLDSALYADAQHLHKRIIS